MATLKKIPNNYPAIKLLLSVKIIRPDRQVAVQGLLEWECEKEWVNRLLDPEGEFLFSLLLSPCISEPQREKTLAA